MICQELRKLLIRLITRNLISLLTEQETQCLVFSGIILVAISQMCQFGEKLICISTFRSVHLCGPFDLSGDLSVSVSSENSCKTCHCIWVESIALTVFDQKHYCDIILERSVTRKQIDIQLNRGFINIL